MARYTVDETRQIQQARLCMECGEFTWCALAIKSGLRRYFRCWYRAFREHQEGHENG